MSHLYLHSAGNHHQTSSDEPGDLKALVADAVGHPVRRIGRFIQLALIGAGRCAKTACVPAETAVYLGSARGDLEITIEVMQSLLRDGHAPKPLSFINTVSNAACFYIASSLQLTARSSFICNRYFAFESVLQLAALDASAEAVDTALVGTVDVVVPPLSDHRKRLGLDIATTVADASHWLCLSRSQPAHTETCRLLACEMFADRSALQDWCERRIDPTLCMLSTGQYIDAEEAHSLGRSLQLAERFEYRHELAYYDSQSGAAIGAFLNQTTSLQQLLHINCDPSGRYAVMWVCRN